MFSEFLMITLLASYQVSLVSSIPHLLVNNTGSDATGTDAYPQPGAPLEVWCWTEKDESNNRRWYDPNNTWLQPTTEPADEDVYVLNAPRRSYVKILKFISYQHSQAGRYYCNVILTNVNPNQVASVSIYIGTPPKVEGVAVMVSGSATSPMISVSWTAVNSTTSVAYTVYYSNGTQPPPGSGSSVQNITGTSLILTSSHGLQTGTTYYIWVSAVSASGQLEGPISDRESAHIYVAPVPESVSVDPTPSEGTLRVTWTRPTVNGGSTITSYSIQYKRSNEMTYSSKTVNGVDTTSSDFFTGLDLSTQYSVRIASVNGLGTGDYSGIVNATTYGYAPSPLNVRASPMSQRGKIKVSWTTPTPPTGSSLTGYSIQYRMGGSGSYRNASDPGGSATSTIVSNLQVGTRYRVRVAAKTELGVGPISYSTTQVKTFDVAPVPESVSVVPTSSEGTLRVTWTRPTVSDGSTINSYSIQYERSSEMTYSSKTVNRGDTTSSDITGLDLSTQYSVRIASVNELGTGDYSGIVSATTYGYAPPPSNVRASSKPQPGKVRVSWTPPTPPTRSSLTGYSIQYRMGSRGSYMNASDPGGSATSAIISNLQVGTRYRVRVAAKTELGVGPNSYSTTQVKTFNAPDQVSNLAVQPSESSNGLISLTVTWDEPNSDVNVKLYDGNYRILPSGSWTGRFTQPDKIRQHIYRNLSSGVDYEVRVRAVSSIGAGEYSIATTIPTTPVVQTSTTTTSVYLQWTSSGGDTFTLYYWKTSTPSDVSTVKTTSLSYNITGLDSNTAYKVIVSARNVLGSSNSSEVEGCTIPEAPDLVTPTTLLSTSINVQWSLPPNSDRMPLTYHVNYTGMSRSTSDTTLTLTGLHPYKEYTISVQTGNKGGLSVPVTGTARTYSDRPSMQPTMRRDNIGRQWCVLQWIIPEASGRNGVIQKYIIELEQTEDNKWNITHELPTYNFSSPASISYNLTNLTPHTTYKWRVAAATVNGTGPFTPNPKEFMTLEDVPGPVANLSYNPISNTSIVVSWGEPDNPNGVIIGYNIRYGEKEGSFTDNRTVNSPSTKHDTIEDLNPYIPYKATVSARTSVGEGEPSSVVFFTLEGAPRKLVSNLTAFWEDGVVVVTWIPLSLTDARGFPLYILSYTSNDDGSTGSVNTTNSSVNISGLDPQIGYLFIVQASTGNGDYEGQSTEVRLEAFIGTETTNRNNSNTPAAVVILIIFLMMAIRAVIVVGVVVSTHRRQKKSQSDSILVKYKESKKLHHGLVYIDNPLVADDASIVCLPAGMYDNCDRTIQKSNFLEVTDYLHANRDQRFEEEYETITNDPNGSDVVAKANKHKNRYGNIYTYDHSRVILSVPDSTENDYINASFIDGYERQNAYIASQGPTETTVSDFWQMIWDQKCPVIVMLTNIEENGRRKCEQYWNEDMDHPLEPGRDFSVMVTSFMGYANYVIREITLTNASSTHCEPLKLKHFHYTTWPDHGVPTHPSSLVKFVQQVRKEYKDSTAPMVVHCSAGVGRTGTFITIDAMIERLKEKDDLNIYQFVTEMRSRRTFMVQTMDQYAFIHDALCDYLTCGDTSIPAHQLRGEIEDMDKVDNDTRMSGFESQFKLLDSVSKKPASADETFSKKSVVEKKNRYKDRFPYYNSYICISSKVTASGADFFNASYVDSYKRRKAFIAAQAPLESTRNDVWEMIWQLRPSTIVLLCDLEEEQKSTCSLFWPDEQTKVKDFGFLQVNHKDTTRRDAGYDVITLEVFDTRKESGEVRNITLCWLKNWHKNDRPPLEAILKLMGDMENVMSSTTGDFLALVMCDDGMGRSGVFICAMSEIERVKVEGQIDVFQTIKGMRIQRPHMVDTPDQYKLCYDFLQSYLDSFDTYANFKTV